MSNVLIVEDNEDSYIIAKKALGQSHEVSWARNMNEAIQLCQSKKFELVLLDIMLPDGDGYAFCSWLRIQDKMKDSQVIFVTSRKSTSDKVLGFSIGADDFVTKPYDPLELKARVDSKVRRQEKQKAEKNKIDIGGIVMDLRAQKVYCRTTEGSSFELNLTPIEFKLLYLFLSEPNKVYSRDEILDKVWGENIYVYSRSVDTHVSKLRKKLGERSKNIRSVHGSGYKFVPNADFGLPISRLA